VRRSLIKIWLLIIPPLGFLLKDILATMVVLSTEPGITPRAALYYHIALVPGTLFVSADGAILFNVLFGGIVGGTLFLIAIWQKNSSQS